MSRLTLVILLLVPALSFAQSKEKLEKRKQQKHILSWGWNLYTDYIATPGVDGDALPTPFNEVYPEDYESCYLCWQDQGIGLYSLGADLRYNLIEKSNGKAVGITAGLWGGLPGEGTVDRNLYFYYIPFGISIANGAGATHRSIEDNGYTITLGATYFNFPLNASYVSDNKDNWAVENIPDAWIMPTVTLEKFFYKRMKLRALQLKAGYGGQVLGVDQAAVTDAPFYLKLAYNRYIAY